MKNTRILSLFLALCLVLLLAGCGTASAPAADTAPIPTPEEAVTDTVSGLLDHLVAGDPDGARTFCAEAIREDGLFDEFFDPEDLEEVCTSMGLTEENGIPMDMLDDTAMDSIANFVKTYNDCLFQDYEITEVAVDGDRADVTVTVDYGVNEEEMDTMDPMDLISEEEEDAIVEEKEDAIAEAMENEGEEAGMAILYNALLPVLMDAISDYIEETEPISEVWNITVENVDGTWQITSIQGEGT